MFADGKESSLDSEETNRPQVNRIDVLPDDVLLGIFDFYVDMNPPHFGKTGIEAWQSLVHVCRRWRSLVFRSPRRLRLQLCCTPKTRARDTLDVWPALPLIVEGFMTSSSGTDDIIAALGQSNRVCQITLIEFTGWQFEEVSAAMQVPFPELRELSLSVLQDGTPPIIPDSFLDGSAPRLQYFSLGGIPFPGSPKLLLSANHLIHLSLLNIPHSGYISPETMVALLTALPNLITLSLGFQSPQSRPGLESRSLPPLERSILPTLNRFRFIGVTEYLEDLVAFVDAPQLNFLYITFFNQIDFDCPRFAQFINRTPTLRLRATDEVHVQFNDHRASVKLRYLTSELAREFVRDNLQIDILCRKPDWQLSSIEQVCNSSLHPFSTVDVLTIEHQYSELVWKNDAIENALWLELLFPFTTVKRLYIKEEFAPGIAAALQELVGSRITEVLPSLENILVEKLEPSGPSQENIWHFVAARRLSGHPVAVSVWDRVSDGD